MKRRLLLAAALLAAATNVVLLRAFLDASAQLRLMSSQRQAHRCSPLVFESKPPASFGRLLVEPAPVQDPALIQGAVSNRAV